MYYGAPARPTGNAIDLSRVLFAIGTGGLSEITQHAVTAQVREKQRKLALSEAKKELLALRKRKMAGQIGRALWAIDQSGGIAFQWTDSRPGANVQMQAIFPARHPQNDLMIGWVRGFPNASPVARRVLTQRAKLALDAQKRVKVFHKTRPGAPAPVPIPELPSQVSPFVPAETPGITAAPAPVVDAATPEVSAADVVSEGSSDAGGDEDVPLYKQPIVIAGAVAVLGGLYWMSKRKAS